MKILIVDQGDTHIDTKRIEDVVWEHDIYRVSSVILYNSQGEVLIAKRATTKEQSPGTWSVSAAGIVESDETYKSNVIKEAAEEIGYQLDPVTMMAGPKKFIESTNPHRQYFMQFFFASCEDSIESFVLQEDEVEAIQWIAISKLSDEVKSNPENYIDLIPEILNYVSTL